MSQKSNVELFVHERIFPDDEDYLWTAGNLPETMLKAIFKKIYMREIFTDANPFHFIRDLDTLQYFDNFNWLTNEFV